jgi:hypothetical protein
MRSWGCWRSKAEVVFPFRKRSFTPGVVVELVLMVANCRQRVSRRYSFPLRTGHKTAYMCTETTVYDYMENLDTPKKWFIANVDTILQIFGAEHRIQKEDLYLGPCFCP